MSGTLVVLLGGARAGVVERAAGGRLRFRYDEAWRESAAAYPLSLSMPLVRAVHEDGAIRAYMEGLLPDSEVVLEAWGREFGVSARNAFGLLAHVGEDAAGAVQFVRPERLERSGRLRGWVQWLSEPEIAERLEALTRDRTSWRLAGDAGRFSLAGAQPKTALLWDGRRWGVPSGATPTTHILKPPAMDLEDMASNEHLCLRIAGELGLPAANSRVLGFEGRIAIVVERYDRLRDGRALHRIHQEDACQALAVSPRAKYEGEGGPGAADLIRLLREASSAPERDTDTFVATLALHWVLGAPDAHARNYSLLLAAGGQVRLAPLYDVISVLPYPRRFFPRKVRMAMQIGGEYRLWHIRRRHWERFAQQNDLDPGRVLARVEEIARAVPAAADRVTREHEGEFSVRFRDAVRENAERCLSVL